MYPAAVLSAQSQSTRQTGAREQDTANSPSAQTHPQASGQTRLSPVKSVSVSKREQGQRGEHFSSDNLEGIVLIR